MAKDFNAPMDPADAALSSPNLTEEHTAEEIDDMTAYSNSGNPELMKFIQDARSGKYVKPFRLNNVSERMAEDIRNITGIETLGNKVELTQESLTNHIDKRHGKKGKAEKTMANDNTLSRIQYVLENYDGAFHGSKDSAITRLSNGNPAPTVVFYKKIDGHYLVVEAVTEAKTKTNRIISAYIANSNGLLEEIKKGIRAQVSNVAENQPLPPTSETQLESVSFSDNVPQNSQNVNSIPSVMAEDTGLNPRTADEDISD